MPQEISTHKDSKSPEGSIYLMQFYFNPLFGNRGWSNTSKSPINCIMKKIALKAYFTSSNFVTCHLLTDLAVSPSPVTVFRGGILFLSRIPLFSFLYFPLYNFNHLLVATSCITLIAVFKLPSNVGL